MSGWILPKPPIAYYRVVMALSLNKKLPVISLEGGFLAPFRSPEGTHFSFALPTLRITGTFFN